VIRALLILSIYLILLVALRLTLKGLDIAIYENKLKRKMIKGKKKNKVIEVYLYYYSRAI